MDIYVLFYGNSRIPLVRAVPDERHLTMWRLHWPDGEVSDMANLTRIKDAGIAICERGPPRRARRLLDWRQDGGKTRSAAPPVRQNDQPVPQIGSDAK